MRLTPLPANLLSGGQSRRRQGCRLLRPSCSRSSRRRRRLLPSERGATFERCARVAAACVISSPLCCANAAADLQGDVQGRSLLSCLHISITCQLVCRCLPTHRFSPLLQTLVLTPVLLCPPLLADSLTPPSATAACDAWTAGPVPPSSLLRRASCRSRRSWGGCG